MTLKMNGRTKMDLDGKLTEARAKGATVVILPPKLTGRRTWEATVHQAKRASA